MSDIVTRAMDYRRTTMLLVSDKADTELNALLRVMTDAEYDEFRAAVLASDI